MWGYLIHGSMSGGYVCEECGETFETRPSRNAHQSTHGERNSVASTLENIDLGENTLEETLLERLAERGTDDRE
jgi:hypothetical protein